MEVECQLLCGKADIKKKPWRKIVQEENQQKTHKSGHNVKLPLIWLINHLKPKHWYTKKIHYWTNGTQDKTNGP